jgi:hypothetical protein
MCKKFRIKAKAQRPSHLRNLQSREPSYNSFLRLAAQDGRQPLRPKTVAIFGVGRSQEMIRPCWSKLASALTRPVR